MTTPVAFAIAVALFGSCATRAAFADRDVTEDTQRLADAQEKLIAGDYALAASLSGPVSQDASLPPPLRAEAHRIYGLALFLLGLRAESEVSLLAYLKLQPDAHLDPALVPPEAIVFFEDVRARHAGELIRRKPRARTKKSWALNLVPPFGQFQNGDRTKGWIVGVSAVALLATNVTTYVLLTSNCSSELRACDDPGTARALHAVNLASGIAAIAVYLYGVIDGHVGYRRARVEVAPVVGVSPTRDGGAFVLFQGRF